LGCQPIFFNIYWMKRLRLTSYVILFFVVTFPAIIPCPSFGQGSNIQAKYLCLPLLKGETKGTDYKIRNRYGIPFIEGMLPLDSDSAKVNIGGQVERIFLLGMTDTNKPSETKSKRVPSELIRPFIPIDGWADPRNDSVHIYIGDQLGRIRLNYADGTTQVFPLILGEGIWWGRIFYDYPEPFTTDAQLRKAFARALRLYPPAPVEDGKYVAVITPRQSPIRSITVENSPAKKGMIVIAGITVKSSEINGNKEAIAQSGQPSPPEFEKFIRQKALRPLGTNEVQAGRQLNVLRQALYSSNESFKGPVAPQMPSGYSGPIVSFEGNLPAQVLTNAFYYNIQDILDKIDEKGMYHTSTNNALSWGGYKSIGTFRKKLGRYYGDTFSRDMGRSLQEITVLGYTDKALRCAGYSLNKALQWETDPSLKVTDTFLPPHWGMYVNRHNKGSFENDGHGLTMLFIFKLWQRLPNRDEWLRSHWQEVKGTGDWILWQFDHPKISGAVNGLLHTTGESADGSGYSVYPDCVCMDALLALAQMAETIGETNAARQWRGRADKMREAISKQYIVSDPKYGRIWTLQYANWTHKGTVLGPLIFLADYNGFDPKDDYPDWRPVNEAAYQRILDSYRPFGFYGQAMGYGQGFVAQSALLLDRMKDATEMLNWTARQIYDPRFGSYIVPEGCQIDPTGKFWYRMGDLGNGVQEGEIVKALRIMIGVDDTRPDRLRFFPRMPYGWNKIAVEKYPILFERSGKMETAFIHYKLERSNNKMKLEITSDKALGAVDVRLGPFERQPGMSGVRVNGKFQNITVEQSGDSWWARFTMSVNAVK
jgi:hypothetical protein